MASHKNNPNETRDKELDRTIIKHHQRVEGVESRHEETAQQF